MRRIPALFAALLLVTMPAAAQSPPDDQDAGPPSDAQPSLPEQASDTARQVLDTVFTFTAETFDSIGQALQNLLGGGEQRAAPGEGSDG